MKTIFIDELTVHAIVGVYDHEQLAPQPLLFNIEMGLASDAAFQSDRLHDTIDYAAVAEFVKSFMATHRYKLLERVAGGLAPVLCEQFKAQWVRLQIKKPGVVSGTKAVGVSYLYEHDGV